MVQKVTKKTGDATKTSFNRGGLLRNLLVAGMV
jgi:hypothetical protein